MILKPYLKKEKFGIVSRTHGSVTLSETLMTDKQFPVVLTKECSI